MMINNFLSPPPLVVKLSLFSIFDRNHFKVFIEIVIATNVIRIICNFFFVTIIQMEHLRVAAAYHLSHHHHHHRRRLVYRLFLYMACGANIPAPDRFKFAQHIRTGGFWFGG